MKISPKMSTNMKLIGISLLILMIPGSSIILPAFFAKKINDKKKSNRFLGI